MERSITVISEYSGIVKGKVRSGCNSALTDVVLVGVMHVCDEYVWSFSDEQLIFIFYIVTKTISEAFGGESASAASISCQMYHYSNWQVRLQANSSLLAHINKQGKKEQEVCQIKCELSRN